MLKPTLMQLLCRDFEQDILLCAHNIIITVMLKESCDFPSFCNQLLLCCLALNVQKLILSLVCPTPTLLNDALQHCVGTLRVFNSAAHAGKVFLEDES